jgi:2-keto-4-pentenoate hydratase/2-oxohepta-3-ene-1,7-dioic acid hydratase in catechol pathway
MKRPGKIICVGRNYGAHAAELGNKVPDKPLFFFKPTSAVIGPGDAIRLPSYSNQVEHEAEIGVVIGRRARNVSEKDAANFVAGIVCVNDVTARDIQRIEEQWVRAKGFDTSCAIGAQMKPFGEISDWRDLEIICRVNGKERQRGVARNMMFGIPFVVSAISQILTLEEGDLIATGTPSGVGPLLPGDTVEVEITGVDVLSNPVLAA